MFQKHADITDTGDGQAIGGLRGFALGNQVVVAVQGILQDLLLDIIGILSAGEQQIHIID